MTYDYKEHQQDMDTGGGDNERQRNEGRSHLCVCQSSRSQEMTNEGIFTCYRKIRNRDTVTAENPCKHKMMIQCQYQC